MNGERHSLTLTATRQEVHDPAVRWLEERFNRHWQAHGDVHQCESSVLGSFTHFYVAPYWAYELDEVQGQRAPGRMIDIKLG